MKKDPWLKKFLLTIALIVLVILGLIFLTSKIYNKQIVDLTYSYDYAIILMPDGTVVKGKVQSWTDFEDGDQIQVKIDGKVYLTHSMNVVLISN